MPFRARGKDEKRALSLFSLDAIKKESYLISGTVYDTRGAETAEKSTENP